MVVAENMQDTVHHEADQLLPFGNTQLAGCLPGNRGTYVNVAGKDAIVRQTEGDDIRRPVRS